MNPIVIFERIREGAKLPEYATPGSAGMDLTAVGTCEVSPCGGRALVSTGLRLRYLAPGYEIQIRPRSGLALKHGVTVLNAPGTIDADYRGEIGVVLVNHNMATRFDVRAGDRIAQAVVCPAVRADVVDAASRAAEVLSVEMDTERGAGGFGSTGR